MCESGKTPFPSPNIADKVAKRTRNRRGFRLIVYRCPHCRLWHLTSPAPGNRKRRDER